MERLYTLSKNSKTMEIDDCVIETNEMNHQHMYGANEDDHKKQPEDFIRKSIKSSQLSTEDNKML